MIAALRPASADLRWSALQVRAERLGAHRGKGRPGIQRLGCDKVDEAEAARIAEREAVRGGVENEVVVLVGRGRIDAPAPAHAEVEHQRAVAVGMDQAVFGAARRDP